MFFIFLSCSQEKNIFLLDENTDSEKVFFTIDSVEIENIITLMDWANILFSLSIKNMDSSSYYLYNNTFNWLNQDPSDKIPYIWGESFGIYYELFIPNSDTLLIVYPNSSLNFYAKIPLVLGESLQNISKEYEDIFNPNFVIKMVDMKNNDTITFVKNDDFKVIYFIDGKRIIPNDSLMNLQGKSTLDNMLCPANKSVKTKKNTKLVE